MTQNCLHGLSHVPVEYALSLFNTVPHGSSALEKIVFAVEGKLESKIKWETRNSI